MSPTASEAPALYADSPDGVLIAYRVHGRGDADAAQPPILLVHGFASDADVTWRRTGWVQALRGAGREVIAVDLRGHGDSDKPTDGDSYAPERLGEDLIAVLDSAGVEVVDVIAYSMGNRVVSDLCALAPERVRRVVVGGAGPQELFATWRLDEARAYISDGVPPKNTFIAQVLGPAIAAGADPDALLACIEGVAGASLAIPGSIPVLFVVGEDDPVPVGVQELAREWGSDVVTIPGRDHVSTLTSRTFKDAAIEFLA